MAAISKHQRRLRAEQDRQRQREQAQRRTEEAEIDRLITEFGWAVCVTVPRKGQKGQGFFAYTIGRSAQGKAELCTFSPDKYLARDMVNFVAASADHLGLLLEGEQVVKLGNAAYVLTPVLGDELAMLEYARARYTFLRALMVGRVV